MPPPQPCLLRTLRRFSQGGAAAMLAPARLRLRLERRPVWRSGVGHLLMMMSVISHMIDDTYDKGNADCYRYECLICQYEFPAVAASCDGDGCSNYHNVCDNDRVLKLGDANLDVVYHHS